MNEELMYLIWNSKSILGHRLQTIDGKNITILHPGKRNQFSGPDFIQARIRIDELDWHGSVEIHVKTSDWNLHKHQVDQAYENVILHVVWIHDSIIVRPDGSAIPTVTLSQYIKKPSQYLPSVKSSFLCESLATTVPHAIIQQMKKRCLEERLQVKIKHIENIWMDCEKDWEETIYRILAQSMGFHQNGETMLRLASSVPLKLLWKYRDSPLRMEALLFGQAGLIDHFPIAQWQERLKIEYEFLQHKHQLENEYMNASHWKYFKLRPQNYPNIRLYELVLLLKSNLSLLTFLLEINSLKNLRLFFESHHEEKRKAFGEQAFKSIVINAIVPILLFYASEKNELNYQLKAMQWMHELKPEGHSIEKEFLQIGLSAEDAADSQAFVQWKKNYCDKGKCSGCDIGKFVFEIA
jgi:hypothetical protein